MLKCAVRSLSLLLFILSAQGQRPPAQQNLTVQVRNASTTPDSPVQGARVAITYLMDGTPITDALKTTNAIGEAYLLISHDKAERGDLRVEITGIGDLAVYQPADGQLPGISAKPSLLLLLPKGSVALLGPPQIEATLKRLSLRVSTLQQQNHSLQGQLVSARAAANAPRDALAEAMGEWAKANGFPEQAVQDRVRAWAEDIQAHAEQKSQEQRALAQFALKNYAAAADSFNQAGRSAFAGAIQARKEAEERDRQYHDSLRQALSDTSSSAHSFQLALQYHRATAVLQDAVNALEQEHQARSTDDAIADLWLEARFSLASVQVEESEVVAGDIGSVLLSQAVEGLQRLTNEYRSRSDIERLAGTQNNLGNALAQQGKRSKGEVSSALFTRAVEAFEHALEVYTKADMPQKWAMTQNNLGGAFLQQGMRSSNEASAALFARGVKAFEHALEVYTKADLPQQWAMTQSNLGVALGDQGKITSGEASAVLFARAIEAFEHALEVYSKADLPQEWAVTQNNLGGAFLDQAERGSGEASTALLARAVQAYEHTLEVYTKADLPQEWAATQNNLAVVLSEQAERTAGAASPSLFARAVQAAEHALEVYTKADLPQDWAMTQNSLGNALMGQGKRTVWAASASLFARAVEAYEHALEVRTKADLPQQWAATQNNLGIAFKAQAERAIKPSPALFARAVEAYEHALEVRTKVDLPQDWAATQNNLGAALVGQAKTTVGLESTALFVRGVQAYRSALEVYTKADLPQDWAGTQNNLGNAFVDQGQTMKGEASAALFAQAAQAYRHALEVYTKADMPQQWARTQNNLGNAIVNQGLTATGEASAELYKQALQAFEHALQVYTKADMPQTWASIYDRQAQLFIALGDYTAADRRLTDVLELYPDFEDALNVAGALAHDHLFQYDRAFALDRQRLKLDASVDTRLDFSEASLTANHPSECLQELAHLVDVDTGPQKIAVRDILKLACQWESGDKASAISTANLLAARAETLQDSGFSFTGTIHFLNASPSFAIGRPAWVDLFHSVETGDGKAMAGALQQLQQAMQH